MHVHKVDGAKETTSDCSLAHAHAHKCATIAVNDRLLTHAHGYQSTENKKNGQNIPVQVYLLALAICVCMRSVGKLRVRSEEGET